MYTNIKINKISCLLFQAKSVGHKRFKQFFSKFTLFPQFLIHLNIYLITKMKNDRSLNFYIKIYSIKINKSNAYYFMFVEMWKEFFLVNIHYYKHFCYKFTLIYQQVLKLLAKQNSASCTAASKIFNIQIQLFLEFFGNLCIFFIFLSIYKKVFQTNTCLH